jgi:hypothetical protein
VAISDSIIEKMRLPPPPFCKWEIDWKHHSNTASNLMARNTSSRRKSTQQWHMVPAGRLREIGLVSQSTVESKWEVNWEKRLRRQKMVMARNLLSRSPSARVWHWVDYGTLRRAGVTWKKIDGEWTGRHINPAGYVLLSRKALSKEDVILADKAGLFLGAKKIVLLEHRLVALKKYGHIPERSVVRHINGKKDDNRPCNLILGTTQDNTRDHRSATLLAMYWRERALAAEANCRIETDMPG